MSEVKLPFNLNPLLNTYHHLAHPLGIISGNIPDQSVWFPWFAHKYINCEYHEIPKVAFVTYSTDRFFVADGIMDRIQFRINDVTYEKLFGSPKETFISNVKKVLNKGLYIQGTYNEKYISAMPSYQKLDFYHDYLIYGYSDEKKCFYASGYTTERYFKEYEIPFFEYYDSILGNPHEYMAFRIMHFNENIVYKTNYSFVIRELNHYLNCTATKEEKCDSTLYGLSVWEKLIEYLTNAEKIDIRFTKIFMEHHKLMNMRLEYFVKEGMIDHNLYQQYNQAFKISNQVYLLSIKYNLAPKPAIKDNCAKEITKVIEINKKILPMVITQIENKINVK